MAKVTGEKKKKNGKLYFFLTDSFQLKVDDYVIVDTVHGIDIGRVAIPVSDMDDEMISGSMKHILRIATEEDIQHSAEIRAKEKDAYSICQQKISEHGLEMKLVSVECSFDNAKILFYFTANGRVDFRNLVKDLAAVFKTRIELRQIGVRDEARMLGGLGSCGRTICCGSFLDEFQPVSIKMAKEQNLSLNPTKISGVCGRLMCCLKYEQDHYEQTRKKMPKIGREVETPDGTGIVSELNILKETVSVKISKGDSSEIKEYQISDIRSNTVYTERTESHHSGTPKPTLRDETVPSEQEDGDGNKAEQSLQAKPRRANAEKRNASRKKHPERNSLNSKAHQDKNPAQHHRERPVLGQPVKRENNKKASGNQPGDAHLQPNPAQDRNTSENARKKPGSNWADAVEKAMNAIDRS